MSKRLKEEWRDWLSENGPWDLFATLTFGRRFSTEVSRSCFERWIAIVDRDDQRNVGRLAPEGRFRWACAIEQSSSHQNHIHALVGGMTQPVVGRRGWERIWTARYQGTAKVLPAESGAISYLVKRVGRGTVLDVGGDIRPPSA